MPSMLTPSRILIVAPNKQQLVALEEKLIMSRRSVSIRRVLLDQRDVEALAGLEFDIIVGAETVNPSFRQYLLPKVR